MKKMFSSIGVVLAMLLALSAGLSALALSAVAGAQGPASQGSGSPQAMVGSAFAYQGELRKDGNPVNATCTMAFRLYDDPASGNLVGEPITLTVAVADGLFTALLNSAGQYGLGAFSGEARWLEVAVKCPGDFTFHTLAPRQAVTAAPYALSLRPGAMIDGAVPGRSALVAVNRADSGSGVWGQSDATDGSGVHGWASAASGTTYGVYGQSDSDTGTGVEGTAPRVGVRGVAMSSSGYTYGVVGYSYSTHGFGVFGYATADSGETYGVWGQVDSTAGIGVRGYAGAASGTTYGVHGEVISPDGRGVVGYATAASGDARGVYGRSNSTEGYGVYGLAAAGSGYTRGVYGVSASPDGSGVYGVANASGCTWEAFEPCAGVNGVSDNGAGVHGRTTTGIAVYGYAEGLTGVAVRAEGQYGGNLIEAWHGPISPDRKFYVADNGNVYADGEYLNPASGYAEMLPGPAGLEPGDVLVVRPDGTLARCDTAYQPTVVGVYAPQAGFVGGAAEDATGRVPLAVVGVVRVKVSAENGPIAPGDLLVAAATASHAMRAGDNPALGTVIGKALGRLEKDTGTLLMLVMLR